MKCFAYLGACLVGACASAAPALDPEPSKQDELVSWAVSPVECHGALQVADGRVRNAKGDVVSLVGPSWFWSTTGWGQEKVYNEGAVRWVADDWQSGIVRAAISGHDDGGYVDDPDANMERARTIIDTAIEEGLYVIVDWHSHHAEDNVEEAKTFFTEIARDYGDTPNVIYEIYNEPLDTTDWETVIKPYSREIIETIRAIDPDNLIIIGTQTWSQRLDKAVESPLTGYSNIAYTLHFYAGKHKDDLRKIATDALDAGLPVMVTEWGGMMHTGDGPLDPQSIQAWTDIFTEYGLTAATWSISDKDESASALRPGIDPRGGWTTADLTPWGKMVRSTNRAWPKACAK